MWTKFGQIEARIVEILNSHLKKSSQEEGPFSRSDGLMKKNWKNLINPLLVYNKKSKEARKTADGHPHHQGGSS